MVQPKEGLSDSPEPASTVTKFAPGAGSNCGPGNRDTVFNRQQGQLAPQRTGPACRHVLKATVLGAVTHSTSLGDRGTAVALRVVLGAGVGGGGLGAGPGGRSVGRGVAGLEGVAAGQGGGEP